MFQLTTSRRGRHLPCLLLLYTSCFNSRPHEEVDLISARFGVVIVLFQLTTSRRGRPLYFSGSAGRNVFQLTTSRRGRRQRYKGICPVCGVSTHDLTKRSTFLRACLCLKRLRFNSRPHEEVDVFCSWPNAGHKCFNSRPHEEVDVRSWCPFRQQNVSTHDLTKRSTRNKSKPPARNCFNSRPHEEVDIVCPSNPLQISRFNSRPHEEVDLQRRKCLRNKSFQLTTSRRGRPGGVPGCPGQNSQFQLTTSRRGRLHGFVATDQLRGSFNSRPHEEVDIRAQVAEQPNKCFNSRPHEEVDQQQHRPQQRRRCFNSRPHEEVDYVCSISRRRD